MMVLGELPQGLPRLGSHRSDLVVIVPRAYGRVRRSQATGRVVVVVVPQRVVVGVMVAPAVTGRLAAAAAGVPVAAAAMREATVGVEVGRQPGVVPSR